MRYNPVSRSPVGLSVDEVAELVNALSKVNAAGTALNRVVSVQLEDRLRSVFESWRVMGGTERLSPIKGERI